MTDAESGHGGAGGPALVIFDCDGVLIDSEPIANRVVGDMLTEFGWVMPPAELDARVRGLSVKQIVPMAEAATGRTVPDGWRETMRARLIEALAEAPLVPGALDALAAVEARGLPWRVASNSSHEEMAVKFTRNGLTTRVAGRCHSHRDVARGKPAPDVFLAAAAAEGVSPTRCLVIEDSVPGATGAVAAGMTVLGLARHGEGEALRMAGATVIRDLRELPAWLNGTEWTAWRAATC